jgi:acetyl-CoA carboxylase biotin carboxyl carrier protein
MMSEPEKPSTPTSDTAQPDSRSTQGAGGERSDRSFGGSGGGGNRHSGRRRSGGGGQQQQQGSSEFRRPESTTHSSVNMVELRELVELISTHGFTDFELEREGFRVRLRREQPSSVSGATSAGGVTVSAPPSTPFTETTLAAAPPPVPAPPSAPPAVADATSAATSPEQSSDADLQTITSPIVGTFYRSASPTSEAFVKIGSSVGADTVVCIVEAMKLMNEILAETSGTIEKIYVENAQPVEYGQPLFGVRK